MVEYQQSLMIQQSSIKKLPVSSSICSEPRVGRGKRNENKRNTRIDSKEATG